MSASREVREGSGVQTGLGSGDWQKEVAQGGRGGIQGARWVGHWGREIQPLWMQGGGCVGSLLKAAVLQATLESWEGWFAGTQGREDL